MNDTYLQDFGTRRPRRKARPKLDPMSGSGRWDDLQLDLRKPHIPRERRSPVPSNPSLTIGGVTMAIRAKAVGEVAGALGFHSTGAYKHRLVTPKAHTYRRAMEERGRPEQTKLFVEREPKYMDIRTALKFHIRKARFGTCPARSLETVKLLWPLRNAR